LTQAFIGHAHAQELAAVSDILDGLPDVLDRVLADITRGRRKDRGRGGMTAEQVLRVFVIKQMHGFSYEQLTFELAANSVYRRFCRFGDFDRIPKCSTLKKNLKMLSPDAMEIVNLAVVGSAKESKIEDGRKVRIDCTNVETDIHEPTDSTLLWDVVRVLTRVMKRARDEFRASFSDHSRRAKRRMIGILNAGKMAKRVPLYRDLVAVTNKTLANAEHVANALSEMKIPDLKRAVLADGLAAELRRFAELGRRVVVQTQRRVFGGESVPVDEKLVSIFETHTDILVKGRRQVEYGHKICLSTGASCMILDCQITAGNPADSKLATGMIERHVEHYGKAPRQAVFDGGFASKDNVASIKKLGVEDVAFSKRCGIEITDMVKSSWVYQRLRNFRTGVEGVISFFKRCFGGSRCTWRGLRSFKTYVWGSVLSCNLLVLARHRIAAT
jgi:IS5 family transposase